MSRPVDFMSCSVDFVSWSVDFRTVLTASLETIALDITHDMGS